MALRDDFKGLRGSILHRSPLPSVDSIVSKLLDKEIHLKSEAGKGILLAPNPFVLAVPYRPPSNFENRPYSKVGIDECSFYTGTPLSDPPATQAPSKTVDPHPRYPRHTSIYNPKGIDVPNPLQSICTRWTPFTYSSYSHVRVRSSGNDYNVFAESVEGRLFFAGESTTGQYPATMHGAI
ncbi:hypothetical protein LWI29_014836 [Acer saccharum]|uniref:Amine oxidase domain-containing protein n=1 Tax=Acer saccharum TaxID=4024 RepID=A0AA39SXZ8_ACESA|nr:hypothetical protein LWI29_014836 [Acer saccharum]